MIRSIRVNAKATRLQSVGTRAYVNRDKVSVFQIHNRGEVHMVDVTEAYETCHNLKIRHQDDIYASRSLYGPNIRKYYLSVMSLERALSVSIHELN